MQKRTVMIIVLSLLLLGLPVIFASEIIPPAFALTKLAELGSKMAESQRAQQAEDKTLFMQVQNTVLEGGAAEAALPDMVILESAAGTLQQGGVYGISLLSNEDPIAFVTGMQLQTEKVTAGSLGYIKDESDPSSDQARMVYFTVEQASTEAGAMLTLKNVKVKVPSTVKKGASYHVSLVRLLAENKDATGVLTTEVLMPDGEKRWLKPLYIAPCVSIGKIKTEDELAQTAEKRAGQESFGAADSTTVFTIGEGTYVVGKARRLLDAAPYIHEQRTMLPIATAAEALGIRYQWDPTEKVVYFSDPTREVRIPLNFDIMTINGEGVSMVAKPQIKNGRMMVPLVSVAQAFGLTMGEDVLWDSASKTVTLKQKR